MLAEKTINNEEVRIINGKRYIICEDDVSMFIEGSFQIVPSIQPCQGQELATLDLSLTLTQ